jgi:hypothetical protein
MSTPPADNDHDKKERTKSWWARQKSPGHNKVSPASSWSGTIGRKLSGFTGRDSSHVGQSGTTTGVLREALVQVTNIVLNRHSKMDDKAPHKSNDPQNTEDHVLAVGDQDQPGTSAAVDYAATETAAPEAPLMTPVQILNNLQKPQPPKTPFPLSSALLDEIERRFSDSKEFAKHWQSAALPCLEQSLETVHTGDYTITIQFGEEIGHRVAEIMTDAPLLEKYGKDWESVIKKQLPAAFHSRISISLTVGVIERATRSPREQDDNFSPARNQDAHDEPCMGDSAGGTHCQGGGTLGPLIRVRGGNCWMVNSHIFDHPDPNREAAAPGPSEIQLVHPANGDDSRRAPRILGDLLAYSGPPCETTRISRSMRDFCAFQNDERVQTDWALFKSNENGPCRTVNKLRTVPTNSEAEPFSGPVQDVFPGNFACQLIHSTGRSSGYVYGVVGETPASVFQNHQKTKEWYVMNLEDFLPRRQWIEGGLGVPGDSGAPVVEFNRTDASKNRLIGQVWGRNKYGGEQSTSRIAYFTSIIDIFDDIEDHELGLGVPDLRTRVPLSHALRFHHAPLTMTDDIPVPSSAISSRGRQSFMTTDDGISSRASSTQDDKHQGRRSSSNNSHISSIGQMYVDDSDEAQSCKAGSSLTKILSESLSCAEKAGHEDVQVLLRVAA